MISNILGNFEKIFPKIFLDKFSKYLKTCWKLSSIGPFSFSNWGFIKYKKAPKLGNPGIDFPSNLINASLIFSLV